MEILQAPGRAVYAQRFERRGYDARQNVKKMSMPPVSGAVPACELVGVFGAEVIMPR